MWGIFEWNIWVTIINEMKDEINVDLFSFLFSSVLFGCIVESSWVVAYATLLMVRWKTRQKWYCSKALKWALRKMFYVAKILIQGIFSLHKAHVPHIKQRIMRRMRSYSQQEIHFSQWIHLVWHSANECVLCKYQECIHPHNSIC